ncbi:MAG: hypothetical protein JJE39_07885, partial [Vicinamibacteria bacterium]|nr:hypothetical protein [Vicinamibacteria bacterium]
IKARIVESDERETGVRVLLNLGHTLAHALEAATSYRVFTHGEAVGYGMEFAVDLSEALGLTGAVAARELRETIAGAGSRTPLPPSLATKARKALLKDKKRQGAKLGEILLAGPQEPRIHLMDVDSFARAAVDWLRRRTSRGKSRIRATAPDRATGRPPIRRRRS